MTILASSTLTLGLIDAIGDCFRRGMQVESMLSILNIPKATFYTWIEDAERDQRSSGSRISKEQKTLAVALVERIAHAQAQLEAELVDAVREAAASTNAKTGIPEWRAAQFLLTHGPTRSRWFEYKAPSHQTIDVQHHPAHTQVRELETTELLALIEPDRSENV